MLPCTHPSLPSTTPLPPQRKNSTLSPNPTHPRRALRVVPQALPQQAALHFVCQAAQQLVGVLLPVPHKAAPQVEQVAVEGLWAELPFGAVQLPGQLHLHQAADAGGAALGAGAGAAVRLRRGGGLVWGTVAVLRRGEGGCASRLS